MGSACSSSMEGLGVNARVLGTLAHTARTVSLVKEFQFYGQNNTFSECMDMFGENSLGHPDENFPPECLVI